MIFPPNALQCNVKSPAQLCFHITAGYFSRAKIIFSRSLRRFSNCFLLCFLSFSSRLLIDFNSSFLISPAFFTT